MDRNAQRPMVGREPGLRLQGQVGGKDPGKVRGWGVGDLGSIPGLGTDPAEGKGFPLQYSGLEYSMDCIVYAVAKS